MLLLKCFFALVQILLELVALLGGGCGPFLGEVKGALQLLGFLLLPLKLCPGVLQVLK